MGKLTAAVSIGQTAWDTLFDSTTKDSDDLTEGTTNKYDTGTPPSSTDDLSEGSTNKYTTEANVKTACSWSTTPEDAATADQTADEVQTAIKAMAWADREIVITEPVAGEHQVKGIHRSAAGELEYDYEETAEL